MKPLRILQVTNRLPWPLNDGGSIAMYNLAKYLRMNGHQVELAALNTLKHRQSPAALKDYDAVHTVDIDTSLKIWPALKGLLGNDPYNVMRFWSEEFAAMLQKLLKSGKFDLLQLEGSYMSMYLPAIRMVSDLPVVLRSHNVEYMIWERLSAAEPSFLKRFYLKDLAKKIMRFELHWLHELDALVPIADQDEAFYRKAGFGKPIQTVNAGVDLEYFQPTEHASGTANILFLGSLEWLPNVQGLDWLLKEVWPEVHRVFPQAQLHIAGKNPGPKWKEMKVPGMVFHGMVPDAAEFLQLGQIFVTPLLSGGGMRLKVVEALSAGKCILSTKVGAEGISYSDGKDILIADTAADWQQQLKTLLANPGQQAEIGRKARELAEARYSWQATTTQLETFYRQEVLQ